jgi:hypothetical protein
VENLAVLLIMVVEEAFLDKGVGYFWCSYLNQERAM